jgi:hypothetical protein
MSRNLQRRPAKPALGNGRIQRAVRRAFYFGSEVTSSDVYDWVYPRRRHLLSQAHRHSARRVLMTMADPIRRVPPHGAWLSATLTKASFVIATKPAFSEIAYTRFASAESRILPALAYSNFAENGRSLRPHHQAKSRVFGERQDFSAGVRGGGCSLPRTDLSISNCLITGKIQGISLKSG